MRNWLWTAIQYFHSYFRARNKPARFSTQQPSVRSCWTPAHPIFQFVDALEVPAVCRVDQSHLGPWQLLGARAYLRPLRDLAVPQQRRRTNRTSGLVSRRAGNLGYLGDVAISAAAAASGAGSERCGHCVNYARTLDRSASAVSADHRWIYFRWLLAMAVYSHAAWSVVAGRTTAESYLLANSPDYQRTEFLDREVLRLGQPGRALIFVHHLYYARVPYFDGDPEAVGNESTAARFFRRVGASLCAPPDSLGAEIAGISPGASCFSCAP